MEAEIAYCGLVCTDCPSYIATQNDDDIAREKTAAFYHEKFGFNLKPEDINCDGCQAEGGRLVEYCRTCEVRKCGRTKDLENCSQCDEQPCDHLTRFHQFSPGAKDSYDRLFR